MMDALQGHEGVLENTRASAMAPHRGVVCPYMRVYILKRCASFLYISSENATFADVI